MATALKADVVKIPVTERLAEPQLDREEEEALPLLPVEDMEEPEIEDSAWQSVASTVIVPGSDADLPHDHETVPDLDVAPDTPRPSSSQKLAIGGSEDFIVPDSESSDADSPVLGGKLGLARFVFSG